MMWCNTHKAAACAVVMSLMIVGCHEAVAVSSSCVYDTGVGATYDLSYLKFPGAYSVLDANAAQYNFTYFFNVCENTAEYPYTENTPSSACVTTTGSTGQTQTGPAPAWQLYNNAELCHRLGNSPTNSNWTLFDSFDVTRGVSLQYFGGDVCPWDKGYAQRSLILHFQCFESGGITHIEPVVETNCQYEIFLKSTFGCPTECFGSNLKLCSSNGVCGYDSDEKRARCFCNPGYTGDYCTNVVDDSVNGTVVGVLVIVSILLVLVLGVLAYLWYRIKNLRLDPAAYDQLAGGPDDATTLELQPAAGPPVSQA